LAIHSNIAVENDDGTQTRKQLHMMTSF